MKVLRNVPKYTSTLKYQNINTSITKELKAFNVNGKNRTSSYTQTDNR
jgi:hypothetical protein